MKVYTKTGDKGTTGLIGGDRLPKSDVQIETYGTVDELNSHLGLLACQTGCETLTETFTKVQSLLFDVGAHLAKSPSYDSSKLPSFKTSSIDDLERAIDSMDSDLEPMTAFVLPGGHASVAMAHVCRTICRRAERRVVALSEEIEIDSFIVVYLNRLSDYLFVLSRWVAYKLNVEEIQWIPQ